MWLARYFPGLHLRPEDMDRMTPELTGAMRKIGSKLLDHEERLRLEHTKAIARAAGMRI